MRLDAGLIYLFVFKYARYTNVKLVQLEKLAKIRMKKITIPYGGSKLNNFNIWLVSPAFYSHNSFK